MKQMQLFDQQEIIRPVNVASIPQRSPFRYPGGKTWLVPHIRRWLYQYEPNKINFYEPFAGGAIVGLTVAFEKLAKHVTLLDLDADVMAVWNTILGGHAEWLANEITSFFLTAETAEQEIKRTPKSERERAFQTILKNRVNHGGIMANGAGRVKHGENGKGIRSRWYPGTLSRRILGIAQVRDRITALSGDGLDFIEAHAGERDAVFFIDPPYTAGGKNAGKRLYTHSLIDHERLFQIAQKITGDFIMTYDDASEVKELAQRHGFTTRSVPMKNTHHSQMQELLIARDFHWIDGE